MANNFENLGISGGETRLSPVPLLLLKSFSQPSFGVERRSYRSEEAMEEVIHTVKMKRVSLEKGIISSYRCEQLTLPGRMTPGFIDEEQGS